MKPRAQFDYKVCEDDKIVIITDKDTGMSVTNDIENVIAYIAGKEEIFEHRFRWIYKDSYEMWNEFDVIKDTWTDVDVKEIATLLFKIQDNQAN